MKTQTPDTQTLDSKTTNIIELTRNLLILEAKYSESTVDNFFEFCKEQYDKLHKKLFHYDVDSFFQKVCGFVISYGLNIESVRLNLTQNILDLSVGIKQAELREKEMKEVHETYYKFGCSINCALEESSLTRDLEREKENKIVDDLCAMSPYLIPLDQFDAMIAEYKERMEIADLLLDLSKIPQNEINSITISSNRSGKVTLSSKFATSELPPLILDKFGFSDEDNIKDRNEIIQRRTEIANICREEHDEIKTLKDAYEFFVIRLIYCILIEHEIVVGKQDNQNYLGLKDKKGHAISNATKDSLFVVKILHMLGVFNDKLKDLDKSNSESKSYINAKLKLENDEVVFNKKKDLLNLIKKDHFFEKLERYFYKSVLLDPTPIRRNKVKKYCIPRLIDDSIVKKKPGVKK